MLLLMFIESSLFLNGASCWMLRAAIYHSARLHKRPVSIYAYHQCWPNY